MRKMDKNRLAAGAKARAQAQQQVDKMRAEADQGRHHLELAKNGCHLLDAQDTSERYLATPDVAIDFLCSPPLLHSVSKVTTHVPVCPFSHPMVAKN